jgi:hypothetical protein
MLFCNISLAVVLSFLWRDHNHMDSYWVSMMDVPVSPIASGKGDPWQRQQYEPLHHTVPQQQTVNTVYCCSFLHNHLCPALWRKQRCFLATNPIILRDSARAHTADAVKDLLCQWQWEILEHPPYSPNISLCGLCSLRQNERTTAEWHITTQREETVRAVGWSLLDINKSGHTNGVHRLPQIWQKVVHMGAIILEECLPQVIKVISEIQRCCH